MEKEIKNFIDFIITQKCSYKCPYCSQSKLQNRNCAEADENTISSFYSLLDKIDKNFEITITGGEALLHPKFFEIIKTTKEKGFKINLITNLSFKLEKYIEIFNLLQNDLNYFDISFHLNQIQNFSLILEKAQELINKKPNQTKMRFFIPLYLIDKHKEKQIDKILRLAKQNNIEIEFQKIRFLNSYKNKHKEIYQTKHNMQQTFANLCWAGSKSLVIYEDGNAYRCYSSRFSKSNYVGNINDSEFELLDSSKVCTLAKCTCPKPSCYNQISDKKDYKTAFKTKISDIIHFPTVALKNKEIIKTKFRQFFS